MNISERKITLADLRAARSSTEAGSNLEYGQVASALYTSGGIISKAQRILGVSRSALTSFMDKNPSLKNIIKETKQKTIELCEEKVLDRIKAGDMPTVKFYLTTQGKEQGWTTRQEVTGKDGEDLMKPTEDDMESIIAKLVAVKKTVEDKGSDKDDSPSVH